MGRPKLNPDSVEKICPTCNRTFKVSFYKRNKQIFCGKKCSSNHPDTLAKMASSQKRIYDKKYGGRHPMQTEATRDNFRKSMIKKHGVDHPGKMENHRIKTKTTLLNRYGDENYNNKEQMAETCIKRYGVSNFMKTADYKEKTKKTCLAKYGVEHPSQSRRYKISHSKNMFKKFLEHERFNNFEPAFSLEEYDGVTKKFNKRYPFKCKRCSETSIYFIDDGRSPVCGNCDKEGMSFFQKEVLDFVRSLTEKETPIVIEDRTVLYPKELDIYIPDKKLAIECNGLYWHSECIGGKNKVYHLNKMKRCLLKEITLIQIFEDEWKFKKEIVKSILKNLIKKVSSERVFARNCVVKIVSKKDYQKFVENNHIQGSGPSSIRLGLYHNGELVSVMGFCKSRFDKNFDYEISRFCNKLDTSVAGGASRLFDYFVKNHSPSSIISYSDRRYFSGNLYLKLGFRFVHNSGPNYFYIMDSSSATKNRMSFQKHKLKKLLPNFDSKLTEWQNMQNHGFDRIWDCGNSKWVWTAVKQLS